MSRIRQPLKQAALKKTDDAFYKNHPEKIVNGKREPIDPDSEPGLASEWRDVYIEEAEKEKGELYEGKSDSDNSQKDCADQQQPEEDDYLHVFVLVPGTTRPVNNLFDFAVEPGEHHSANRSYWGESLITSVKKLKTKADKKNEGDAEYNSATYFEFSWSGDNNHYERVTAGRKLADKLWCQYSSWRSRLVYFHLIGHSHGGNTINSYINALSGKDPKIKFGDRWFIKSITYLSTPFFQIIEQPDKHRVHSSAIIFNIRNYYDLTQLCIADFIVEQASEGAISQLAPLAKKIKEAFNELSKAVSNIYPQLKSTASCLSEYYTQKAKENTLGYVLDYTEEVNAAKDKYDAEVQKLNQTVIDLKLNIDKLAQHINELLDKLHGLLITSRNSNNANEVDKQIEFVSSLKDEMEYCRNNSQKLIDQASDFKVGDFFETLFIIIEKLMKSLAALLENDRFYEIIILNALSILQFFDDTLQDNDHYSNLQAFDNKLEEVDGLDTYNNKTSYAKFRGKLEPHEKKLHGHLGESIRGFKRGKWSDFSTTKKELTPILRTIIAQVAGTYIRPYKEYPADLANKAATLNGWNEWAEEWVPKYNGGDLATYLTSLEASSTTIGKFVDEIIDNDLELFEGDNPLDDGIPGTVPYLAVVAHSVSRQKFSKQTMNALVSNVKKS